uniref:Beta-defensin-like domain-containing protein n=1 Tax=Chrysemys picta bellii TaxID=8478 RepID=A0A8C3I5J0_CHRPI
MKILYLLCALFFLVLQSSPGFTEFINSSRACRRARGSCFRVCFRRYRLIGTCGQGLSCCRTWVSSGSTKLISQC